MKEHGLIFKGQLIPALLDGSKTLTRRMLKHQPKRYSDDSWFWQNKKFDAGYCHTSKSRMMGFMLEHGEYQIGDRIWVREAFRVDLLGGYGSRGEEGWEQWEHLSVEFMEGGQQLDFYFLNGVPTEGTPVNADYEMAFRMGNSGPEDGYRPSIHMPRWASRITLEITDVRVERLQDISEDDALCEIARTPLDKRYVVQDEFMPLWNSLYGNWDENPWVYVISFKKVEA